MSRGTTRVLLVRHPQTEQNAVSRYIGRGDSPFSELGRRQAEWLKHIVAEFGPRIVYTSPLGRAHTAAQLVTPEGVRLEVLDDLQEVDFGEAEGHTHAELDRMGIRLDYISGGPVAPGGERGLDFDERVLRAASVIEEDGGRIVVVTHGGVMRRLLTHWLVIPVEAGWRLGIRNGSTATVRLSAEWRLLERLLSPPEEGPIAGVLGDSR